MKYFIAFCLLALAVGTSYGQQSGSTIKGSQTGSVSVLENKVSNGNMSLKVKVGSTPTDALVITGSTAMVAIPQGLTIGGNEALTTYDEGTYTPTLSTTGTNYASVTYAVQEGHYTKIGRTVCYVFTIRWTNATGSPTGAVAINGLPFSALGSNTSNTTSVHTINIAYPAGTNYITGAIGSGSSSVILLAAKDNAADASVLPASNSGAVTRTVYSSGCYQAS